MKKNSKKQLNKNTKKKMFSVIKPKMETDNEISRLIIDARKYHDAKQLIQANYMYQQVLQLQPDNISALNGLGMIAMDASMLSIAMELFDFALEQSPENISLNNNLALVYTRMDKFTEAIQQYTEILQLDGMNANVHGELARLYLQTGDISQALTHYHLAFRLNPSDARNFNGLAQLDAESITQEDINMVESLLRKDDLPLDDRRSFYFALGAIYDASEQYDEAFANYAVANMSKVVNFDSKKHVEYIDQIIDTFTPELFGRFSKEELCQSQQPVFIIGMPRSGTTVVEQILNSHADVYAGGELNLINNIATKLRLTMEQTCDYSGDNSGSRYMSFEYNSAESLSGFARYYLNDINNLALKNTHTRSLRITDKMPDNFIYLGLIALLFPNAHVIHCRRSPLEVSLSCFFHDFAGDHGYACDLKDIGLYYQQYDRLMDHWKKVLPIKIHTVEYEAISKQSEANSKELIEFVGLEWKKGNKDIEYQSGDSLLMVENAQDQSVMRHWCNYEKHLQSLKQSLKQSLATSENAADIDVYRYIQ